MKNALRVLLFLLPVSPAFADDAAQALDLSLPQSSLYAKDPPGTWYGDTSGVPASVADGSASRCPTAPDGTPTDVTGSFTTGMGYSSRMGSSTYNAVDLNYCKSRIDDDGNESTFNVQLHVDQVDGDARRVRGMGPMTPPRGRR